MFSAFFSFSSLAQDADENCVDCQNQIERIQEIEEQIANLQRIKEELEANLSGHLLESHMDTAIPVDLLRAFFQEWRSLADLKRRIWDPTDLGISGPRGTTRAIVQFFTGYWDILGRIQNVNPQSSEQITDFFFQYDSDNRFPRSLDAIPMELMMHFFQEWKGLADLQRRIEDPRDLGISGEPGTVDAIEDFFQSYWDVLERIKVVDDEEGALEFFNHYRDE